MKEKEEARPEIRVRPWAVLVKGLFLFLIVNFLFALPWTEQLGKVTIYNHFVSGVPRFLNTTNVDALFSTHIVAREKQADEFRVMFLGDSATWGYLLDYKDTVAFRLDAAHLQTCSGATLRFYNLASPTPSILKDFLLMERAQDYQPDLFIWFVTLKSFTDFDKQSTGRLPFPPEIKSAGEQIAMQIMLDNLPEVSALLKRHNINYDLPVLKEEPFWNKTLIAQRGYFADLTDLQLSGLQWGSTLENSGTIVGKPLWNKPISEKPIKNNLTYEDLKTPTDISKYMRLDIFDTAVNAYGNLPLLIVNNPMFITNKAVGKIRYNEVYPRWAYDQYRDIMSSRSQEKGWMYLDLWNAVPAEDFTNSSFHRDEVGEMIVVEKLIPMILAITCSTP